MIFSTDMYHPDTVKSMEKLRRGGGHKFIIKGASTKKPKFWKEFLSHDENKHQLIKLLFNFLANKFSIFAVNKSEP